MRRTQHNNGLHFSTKRNYRNTQKRHTLLIAIAILIVICIVSGVFFIHHKSNNEKQKNVSTEQPKNKISKNTIETLSTGMKFDEVEKLIGTEGNKIFQTVVNNQTIERYQWNTKDTRGTLLLTFADNILININRSDEIKYCSEKIDQKTADKIKPNTSYNKAADIIGSKGYLISETANDGIVTSIYSWHTKTASLTVTCVDNLVQTVNFHKH